MSLSVCREDRAVLNKEIYNRTTVREIWHTIKLFDLVEYNLKT